MDPRHDRLTLSGGRADLYRIQSGRDDIGASGADGLEAFEQEQPPHEALQHSERQPAAEMRNFRSAEVTAIELTFLEPRQ